MWFDICYFLDKPNVYFKRMRIFLNKYVFFLSENTSIILLICLVFELLLS